jgi:hypothetical protein
LLTRRGVTLSLAVLGTMLASGLVTAAPAGLAAAISQAAMAGAASGASLTFTLWRAIAMNKFKFGILTGAAIGCAVTLAAGHFFNSYQIEIKPRAASARKATAISFDGRKWMPWRTEFAVQGDKLVSLPQARAGYDYGHLAGGRGPVLMTGIGDSHLKNYRAEFEYCVTGPDPTFNPYNLPEDYHDGCIFFHVADARENWNERGNSYYLLGVRGDGTWALLCTYNNYCAVPVGYGNVHRDAERELAEGEGLRIDRVNGNKYAIELSGKRIRIWVDGDKIVDMIDNKMDETIGGQTLDHGGVGFHWGLDAMGWMRNFSLKAL